MLNEAEIRSRERAQYDWMLNRIAALETMQQRLIEHIVELSAARGEGHHE